MTKNILRKILVLILITVFVGNNIPWAAPIEWVEIIRQSSLRPSSAVSSPAALEVGAGLKAGPIIVDGLKSSSLGGRSTDETEANFDKLVETITENLKDIKEKGGFIFDIDDTLLTSVEGRPETLDDYPLVTEAICDLLCAGFKIYITSSTSYYEQAPRVRQPIVKALRERGRLNAITDFIIYTAESLAKRPFRVSRGRVKVDIDHNYTDKNKIDDRDIETVRGRLRDLLSNWKTEIIQATADRLKELSPGEKEKIKEALEIEDLEYETLRQKFMEYQKQGIKQKFKNARLAYLDGEGPKINVYAKRFPPNDTDEEAPWIEFRDGVMIALRIAAFENRQYPIFRETIIEALKKALGPNADQYDIKPGGASTIDITKKGLDKATAVQDIIGPKGNKRLFFYIGDKFKTRRASDGVVLTVLPAENCVAVCKQGAEGEALRIGNDHHTSHRLILAVRDKVRNAGADGYGLNAEALACRLEGKFVTEEEHKGRDGDGGINKIAKIAILTNQARDLKQGAAKGVLPSEADESEMALDYNVPFMSDNFFNKRVLPLLKTKTFALSKPEQLPTPQSRRVSIQKIWDEWTIRVIPDWRKDCREEGISEDIIEHYGRRRLLTLIDYNDYRYLQTLPDGEILITALLFHGFVHTVAHRQGTGNMSAEEIEDYVLSLTPIIIEDVRDILKDTKKIDEFNEELNIKEQKRRLNKIQSVLRGISRMAGLEYTPQRYNKILKDLREANLQLNYMQVYPENKGAFTKTLRYRHNLAGRLSEVVLKHPDCLAELRKQANEDLRRYIEYAITRGITTRNNGQKTLELARENIRTWFAPESYIPDYIKQGLVRGKLEGRSEDSIYDYAGNVKSEGWKEFGTAGIRNQAVQSAFGIIRKLELEEFAGEPDDPRVPILTGPYLINSVSLIKQAMTIIKLIGFIEYRIETGKWPQEVSREEREKWPKIFSKKLIEDIKRKTITIAYDSRLNGRYFAYLLAAVFLKNGFKVNLFDSPAGVPGGVIVTCGADFFGDLAEGYDFNSIGGSVFGVLISASHSEPWFNGFKVFLGHMKSQVDETMREMLKATMKKVSYDNMRNSLEELANSSIKELEQVLEANNQRLAWLGGNEPKQGFNYCGGRFVPFYTLYYDYLSKRSPLAHINGEELKKIIEARRALKVLYTAFYGVGAKMAANLPGFFERMGYRDVELVKKQTEDMDGRFPGHLMPDPGVVKGWMSNLWNYIEQTAGRDFSHIKEAVDALNQIEIGAATDPDIDRAGMVLDLPEGAEGNIKEDFIEWVKEYIDDNSGQEAEDIKSRVIPALGRLEDKLLLTANDAWCFMAYYKLKIMEKYNLLKKDRLYIILKSHVTTSGLEKVAEYFSDRDYQIDVVDTYVGFTEIGKKSRDLFAAARAAWQLKEAIEADADLRQPWYNLVQAYQVVREYVPYETAGVEIINEAIEDVEKYHKEPSPKLKTECLKRLNIIAHMEILMGVEESNGYGELGYYNPEEDKVENAHIAEKDGSLAVYEFLELLAYGKAILNKSGYQMYTDMLRELRMKGWTATDNQFLRYPGFQGKEQKVNCLSALEKILALKLQKMLDYKEKPVLFGRYKVLGINIYRNEKYDKDYYLGFPEEGVRFRIKTPSEFSGSTTYRPSGTGNSNRDYNWLEARGPGEDEDIESYRRLLKETKTAMVETFFGVPGETKGEHKPDEEHQRFLVALRGVIDSEDKVMGLFKRALGVEEIFTPAEERLYKAVKAYVKNFDENDRPVDERVVSENTGAWAEYLATEEAKSYPQPVNFYINNKRIQIPNALARAWQASLVGYLSALVKNERMSRANVACDDLQIAELVAKRIPKVRVKVVSIPEKWIPYVRQVRPEVTFTAVTKILARIRPDITAEEIYAVIQSHTHPVPRVVDEPKRRERLAEQVILVHDLKEEYHANPRRTVLVHNPYPILDWESTEKVVNITEVMACVEDIPLALGRESTSIGKFRGNIVPDANWAYDVGKIGEKEHIILVFEIEKEERGAGRFTDLAPIIEHYKREREGVRVFTKEIGPHGRVGLKEVYPGTTTLGPAAPKSSSAGSGPAWWHISLVPTETYDKARQLSYEDPRIAKVRQAISSCKGASVRLDTLANDTDISVEEVYAVMVRINSLREQISKFMFIGPAEPHPTRVVIPYTRYSSQRSENEEKFRVEKALNKSVARLPLAVDILQGETKLTLAGIKEALELMNGDRSWPPDKFYIDGQRRVDYAPKSSSAGTSLSVSRLTVIEGEVKQLTQRVGEIMLQVQTDEPGAEPDRKLQQLVDQKLRELIPGSVVIGEESFNREIIKRAKLARFVWVADPLDGTKDYKTGKDAYCIAITLLEYGHPIYSLIYSPQYNIDGFGHSLFEASRDRKGAYLNGIPVYITNTVSSLREAKVAIYKSSKVPPPSYYKTIERSARELVYNEGGSGLINVGRIACSAGYPEHETVYLKPTPSVWDIIHAAFIIQKLGGEATYDNGKNIFPLDMDLFDFTQTGTPRLPSVILGAKALHQECIKLAAERTKLYTPRPKSFSAGKVDPVERFNRFMWKGAIYDYQSPQRFRTSAEVNDFLRWLENEATLTYIKEMIEKMSQKGFRLVEQAKQEKERSSAEVDFRKNSDQEDAALLSRIIYSAIGNRNSPKGAAKDFILQKAKEKKISNLFKIAVELARSKEVVDNIKRPLKVAFHFAIYTGKDRMSRQSEHINGEDALRRKILQLEDLFRDNPMVDWQLTAIDDGSPNNSGEFAENILRNEYPHYYSSGKTKVLYMEDVIKEYQGHPILKGLKTTADTQKGGTLEWGMYLSAKEGADILIYTDTDTSSHLGLSGNLIGPIENGQADVVFGSRAMPDSLVLNRPFMRKIKSWQDTEAYSRLVISPLLRPISDIRDTQNSFKAFRREVLTHILPFTVDKKLSFDTELLLLAREGGYRLKEIGMPWVDTPARTTVKMRDGLKMAKRIFAQRRRFKSGAYNLNKNEPAVGKLTDELIPKQAKIDRLINQAA